MAGTQPAAALSVNGVEHTATGSATLTIQPDLTLRVGNIGSSGDDGVSIDRLASPSFTTTFEVPDEVIAGTGFLDYTVSGTVDGVADQNVVSAFFDGTGSAWRMTTEFIDLGATESRVDLYDDNILVHSEIVFSAVELRVDSDTSNIPTLAFGTANVYDPAPPLTLVFNSDAPQSQVSIDGGTTHFTLTHAVITPTDGALEFEAGAIADTWRGNDLAHFDIVNESISFHHAYLSVFGSPDVDVVDGDLTVSNIGSSGEDGVVVGPEAIAVNKDGPPVRAINVVLDPIEILTAEAGDEFAVKVFDADDPDAAGPPLGSVRMQSDGGGEGTITLDFSGNNATDVVIEIFDGDDPVDDGTFRLEGKAVATENSITPVFLEEVANELSSVSVSLRFDGPLEFDVPATAAGAGFTASGDRIRITTLDGDPIQGFSGLGLFAANIEGFMITNVSSTPVPEPEAAGVFGTLLGMLATMQRRRHLARLTESASIDKRNAS